MGVGGAFEMRRNSMVKGGAPATLRRGSMIGGGRRLKEIDPLTLSEQDTQKIAQMHNSKFGEMAARMRMIRAKLHLIANPGSMLESMLESCERGIAANDPSGLQAARDEKRDREELRKVFGEEERTIAEEHGNALASLRLALETPSEYMYANGEATEVLEKDLRVEVGATPVAASEKTADIEDPKDAGGGPESTQRKRLKAHFPATRKESALPKIVELVHHCAPFLLEGLTLASQRAVVRALTMKEYPRGTPIFAQDDLPDGYYFILSGEVAIYKKLDEMDDADFSEQEGIFHETYGRKLVCLHREQGFGELAHASVGHPVVRSATVVADGDEESRFLDSVLEDATAAPKIYPTICLHVPAHTYILQMSKEAGEDLRRKVVVLESSLLFQHRPLEKLCEIAQHLRSQTFAAGAALAHSGCVADEIFLLKSGEITLFQTNQLAEESASSIAMVPVAREANAAKAAKADKAVADQSLMTAAHPGGSNESRPAPNERSAGTEESNSGGVLSIASPTGAARRTEIALLGPGDIFGVVDVYNNRNHASLGQMTRSAICTTTVEVLVLSAFMFKRLVLSDERSAELVKRLVEKRTRWEALRLKCTRAYPELSTRITHETMHLAK